MSRLRWLDPTGGCFYNTTTQWPGTIIWNQILSFTPASIQSHAQWYNGNYEHVLQYVCPEECVLCLEFTEPRCFMTKRTYNRWRDRKTHSIPSHQHYINIIWSTFILQYISHCTKLFYVGFYRSVLRYLTFVNFRVFNIFPGYDRTWSRFLLILRHISTFMFTICLIYLTFTNNNMLGHT